MDYRAVPEDDESQFVRVLAYAFDLVDGPPVDAERPWDEVGKRRALYDGDEVIAGCLRFDFDARLRGTWRPLGGVAGVATEVGKRRRGHSRTLLCELLAEFRDDDVPLAALHPFSRSFYRDLGWGTCERLVRFELAPGSLRAAGIAHHDFRRVAPAESRRLQPVHETAMEGRTLTTRRADDWWRWFVFHRWGTDRHVRSCVRDGTVCGYVSYSVGEEDGQRMLVVDELVGVDDDATRRLYWFLANHESQIDLIRLPRPDGDLLERLPDDDATAELRRGSMVRVTDVETTLSAVPYPDDLEGSVTLAVSDHLASWNDDQFVLTVEDGAGRCTPADDADSSDTAPEVTLDIGTLSQLVVGYHDVSTAERLGDLAVESDRARTFLSSAFPPETVGPLDVF